MLSRALPSLLLLLTLVSPILPAQARPFGTLRDQAARQQAWLAERLEQIVPALMRRDGVDMWIVPMREYNEDPVFSSLVSPTTFAARRRTIYVFFDRGTDKGVERLALGGTSQGDLYQPVRATHPTPTGEPAELWGDAQWQVLRDAIAERNPTRIGINVSRVFAFGDGLTVGEYEGLTEGIGPEFAERLVRVSRLPVDLIATRLPDEGRAFVQMTELVHRLIGEMFSDRVVTPGTTRASDLVWWWRQRVNDLGLGTWFQPSISVQRVGATADSLGDDPVIKRGDVLHCDVGLVAFGLNTDTQHNAYVLREGETDAPPGLRRALANANQLQDLLFEEVRPGRTGNAVLQATLLRMRSAGLDGSVYSHPIGLHGHGAGPLIGLWDRQEGVPGRGDHTIIPNMWFSSELQVTTPVPEWNGQRVRIALEEDFILGAGQPRWALARQNRFHLIQ